MQLHISVLYNFILNYFYNWISNIHYIASLKTKIMQRTAISNIVKTMLFISDEQYYIPIKLYQTASSTHLFKITGIVMPDKV